MFELIFPAWLAGIILVLTTGPLGSFIVWRRMSSFGDTLSHSSVLGLAISALFNISSFYIIFCFISFLAIFLAWLEEILPCSLETIFSVISHTSLSLGIVLISLISTNYPQINIPNYLFGDLLTVAKSDLVIMLIGSIVIISFLIYRWNALLLATINKELAQIDGINIFYARLTIMLMTALTIAMAIKFVGALLITSLLIIPPATAQHFSESPEKMVFISIIVGIISVTGGIFFSVFYNTPASPSIVLCSSFLFLLSNIKNLIFQK
ncbi:MAG: zinc ABC transporter permease subunit ZnuB [Buchnera aphidicola (Brevicoryne brassicae)]|uniref:High-affinity zinc uptake system membrane protein ZnuB n=1 Tax=Buchnera aphidicola (Brevicoryne brassicae) TaxID=911343 RepID=A0AAJ5PU79_9GAMM|nr:zinc ABC transporter permease subunit ZnuB [Buchnera aphidicola]QCI19880.1 zinc ABC transporter permease subunit ZnuB [Buchnera aphidicola (Brevicoryne brassicae)]WAI18702.1 MAG: zinc ABC transporter permease subunit ZnuB [Buchnera aphidicola (Brevicoryne brassicae)]